MGSFKPIFYAEGLGFSLVLIMLWLNEVCDLPHHLFGAPPTPINWWESLMETGFVLVLACAVMAFNARLLKKIQGLEELLPICAHCKNIRKNDGSWEQIDDYISACTATEFTHTICPACATLLYPEAFPPPKASCPPRAPSG
jgi:hypothetical protein